MAARLGMFRVLLNYDPKFTLPTVNIFQKRHAGYKQSEFVCDLENFTKKYEVSKSMEDWKYVERLLPLKVVPEPTPKSEYPSTWQPQSEDAKNFPYFVARSRNHMMPVYLKVYGRGSKRITSVKRIQGDIWLLEQELRKFLQSEQIRPIRSQVNELSGAIYFHGDYVNAIKYWLTKRGL